MNIDVKQLTTETTLRYPYTHRVEVSADALAADKVNLWLDDNKIPHTRVGWGVYYLNAKNTSLFLLRWS